MKEKILIVILTATFVYSLIYKIQIEDSIIEDVNEEYSELYEQVINVEHIDVYQDMDDTYVPVFSSEDQKILDEYDKLVDEALGIYFILDYFSIVLFLFSLFYYLEIKSRKKSYQMKY